MPPYIAGRLVTLVAGQLVADILDPMTVKVDLPKDLVRRLQPLLRDLGTTGLDIVLDDAAWDGWSADSFRCLGRGIQWREGSDLPWDLVNAMDTIQDEVIESRLERGMGVWPTCPGHDHIPVPKVVDERAVWQCPNTMKIVVTIGDLAKIRQYRRLPSR